jgi:hypothetical protein
MVLGHRLGKSILIRPLNYYYLLFLAFFLAGSAFCRTQAHSEPAPQQKLRIGVIDFFGYAGLNPEKVLAALPVKVGDSFSSSYELHAMSPKIREAILKITGRPATNVAIVEIEGEFLIYIGLAGDSIKTFTLNPEPKGTVQLPAEAIDLYHQAMNLLQHSVATGATEDHSKGYGLSSDPALRAKELAIHDYATQHEALLRSVLVSSPEAKQRIVASHFLGYSNQSQAQIDALVVATRDSDGNVRNNAARALGVLAESDPKTAARIPPASFIEMLASEKWIDRNKAGFLLETLTKDRNPQVLAQLRSQALVPLIEMARWHNVGHASVYRVLLGRIAGIEEAHLQELADKNDQVEEIISAAQRVH